MLSVNEPVEVLGNNRITMLLTRTSNDLLQQVSYQLDLVIKLLCKVFFLFFSRFSLFEQALIQQRSLILHLTLERDEWGILLPKGLNVTMELFVLYSNSTAFSVAYCFYIVAVLAACGISSIKVSHTRRGKNLLVPCHCCIICNTDNSRTL